MKNLQITVEKFLLGIIALMFTVPGVLTVLAGYHKLPACLGDVRLVADAPQPNPRFSFRSFFHANYQQGVAAHFEHSFAGRELLVRINNEIYFRAFKFCPMASTAIYIGRNDVLYEDAYLTEYCLTRINREQLLPTVRNLKLFQEECQRRGIAFVLLITPSKASIEPENLPKMWAARYNPLSRGYDLLVPLLKEAGIHYVDGHALALQIKGRSQIPVFPKGGIHWGGEAVMAATNEIIASMQAQGKTVRKLDAKGLTTTGIHRGDSEDLLELMNLYVPWKYPVTTFAPRPHLPKTHYNVAAIGGSFVWGIVFGMGDSWQFPELDFYYYYKQLKFCLADGDNRDSARPVKSVDFSREIYAADAVILEINEQRIPDEANNLTEFLPDALAHIPPAGKPVEFLSGRFRPSQWGETINFRSSAGKPGTDPQAWLTGFSTSEPTCTWTVATDAIVRLDLPPSGRDVALDVITGAMLDPGAGNKQSATVFANDEIVGHWTFPVMSQTPQKVVIPERLVEKGGALTLRFHIDHPVSPAEAGLGGDPRKLGLSFSEIRLSPIDKDGLAQ